MKLSLTEHTAAVIKVPKPVIALGTGISDEFATGEGFTVARWYRETSCDRSFPEIDRGSR